MELNFSLEGGDFTQAGMASSRVKTVLKQLGVDAKCIKNIVIAIYEAEVNVVAHAYSGQIKILIDKDKITTSLKDSGPGIPDIELAMQEGFSTASKKVREMGFGAGMGLPNIKKNTDELKIDSIVGEGTTVTMINFFR